MKPGHETSCRALSGGATDMDAAAVRGGCPGSPQMVRLKWQPAAHGRTSLSRGSAQETSNMTRSSQKGR